MDNSRFKFRVWDKKENILIERGSIDIHLGVFSTNNLLDSSRFVIEQCTGLKDKNEKLIYEGDILGGVLGGYIHWCDTSKSFQLFTPWGECMGCAGDVLWAELVEDDGKLEVIGNIHENPELLENKDEKITVKIGKRYLTREKRLAFVHADSSYNGEKIYWYVITGDSTQYFCDEHGENLGDSYGYRKVDMRDLLENKDE